MNIKVAASADIPSLCDLLASLFTQEAEFQPDLEAQIRGLVLVIENREAGDILVARNNGKVVGMVNILYTVSTALGARVGILEDMVVSASERNSGIGSKLLVAAQELARKKGCKRITLLTDSDNDNAQRFYRRHGFTLSAMAAFRKSLE